MSIVFSEKTRRTRLALRWPFSRQITLSVGTLLVLLAVWWAVAAQQWISPLFLPPPGQVLANLLPSPGRRALWMPRSGSIWRQPGAYSGGAAGGGDYRHSGGDCDGLKPDGARHPRPAD
jgi:taurine transport system permease protein